MPGRGLRNTPFLSVVIRTKDEADRLRLTLQSLVSQVTECEIIVVDDGSTDHTSVILAEMSPNLPLTVIRHLQAKGRAAASTVGARVARGEVLLFLDGDTIAGPDFVDSHARHHAQESRIVGRGNLSHLRCTRLLRDPEQGTPWLGHEDAVARLPAVELERMRVTREQVRHDFEAIERRAQPGIYSGVGPRQLHDLEWEALLKAPECPVLWSAASGSNFSVRRQDFMQVNGFNEKIDINEHRELALRLVRQGCRMMSVPTARSYHLIHRSGWRNPLTDTRWEAEFLQAHPIPEVALLVIFWASLSPDSPLPPQYRIMSLPELAGAARGNNNLDYDIARRCLNFSSLGANFWCPPS